MPQIIFLSGLAQYLPPTTHFSEARPTQLAAQSGRAACDDWIPAQVLRPARRRAMLRFIRRSVQCTALLALFGIVATPERRVPTIDPACRITTPTGKSQRNPPRPTPPWISTCTGPKLRPNSRAGPATTVKRHGTPPQVFRAVRAGITPLISMSRRLSNDRGAQHAFHLFGPTPKPLSHQVHALQLFHHRRQRR